MASVLVRTTCLSTSPRWISVKFICAIIICLSIGWVSSDSHLFNKAKIDFRTIGHPFPQPLLFIHFIGKIWRWHCQNQNLAYVNSDCLTAKQMTADCCCDVLTKNHGKQLGKIDGHAEYDFHISPTRDEGQSTDPRKSMQSTQYCTCAGTVMCTCISDSKPSAFAHKPWRTACDLRWKELTEEQVVVNHPVSWQCLAWKHGLLT